MSRRADRRRLVAAALLLAALPGLAAAHGAMIEARPVAAIAVDARFEDGTPMAGAQMTVFAPDAPATAWLTGVADATGRFVFEPGPQPGRWAVQARLAGHGAMTYVQRGAGAQPAGAATSALSLTAPGGAPGTALQRAVMVACVAWGCLGTALYARRRRAG